MDPAAGKAADLKFIELCARNIAKVGGGDKIVGRKIDCACSNCTDGQRNKRG